MGVWIDTDMGFDDMAAIFLVARAGLAIDGVSLVAGNAPLDQVRSNAAGAAAAFSWTFPIHAGRAHAVLGGRETAAAILGERGMPSAGRTLPQAALPPAGDAFAALCNWLENADAEPRRLLALGPLTNIAALALARPDLAARISDLTWMGGAIAAGNHTASAEFNAYADPEALAIVLGHGLPLTMIDLDLCRKVPTGPGEVDGLRRLGGRNAALIADLLSGYVDIAIRRGRAAMPIYDAIAAAVFVAPELAELRQARIEVELQGRHTRGRTVVETRASHAAFNARFAADIDAAGAHAMVLDALAEEARK